MSADAILEPFGKKVMERPMHVCIITTAHPVDDVRVKSKIADAFLDQGWRVSWVGPGHGFFEKCLAADRINYELVNPLKGRLDRLFSGRRIKRRASEVSGVDVYYAPDPDSIPIALDLARRNDAQVVFDIHEIYHGSLMDRWLMGLKLAPIREIVRGRIEKHAYKSDLVIGVSESVLDPYCMDRRKRMVIRNCAPNWFADGSPADVFASERPYIRLMHGKADFGRGSLQVMEAVAIAVKKVERIKAVMFTMQSPDKDPVGQRVTALAEEMGVGGHIELNKGVPMRQMPDMLKRCDVGMIAYGRGLGVDSLPNRFFEYMAVGLPIIAPEYAVEMARIIKNEQCGVLADFEDPSSVAECMTYLANNPELSIEMGRRGRTAFVKSHNWESEVGPLFDRLLCHIG